MMMNEIWPDTSHKERDAYYQAGHAIVALRESLEVVQVSIEDQDNVVTSWIDLTYPNLDQARLNRSIATYTDTTSVIRALLAGPAALLRYSFGTCSQARHPTDFNLADPWMAEQEAFWRAISLAGKTSDDSPSLIRGLWREINCLIQGNEVWPAIEAVANMLLITDELTGYEVSEIARHALGSNTARF